MPTGIHQSDDPAPRLIPLALPPRAATGDSAARPSRQVDLEIQWLRADRGGRPLLVFLHEGLGSVALWQGFPAALCEAADLRGLVYSRPGYGRSTPRAPDERWPADYLHTEADVVLPALLTQLGITEAPWLLGHSDGGSIALIRAANAPDSVAGCIVIAPHLMVEAFGLTQIRAAREAWHTTDLRSRLARYHADVESAFFGWNDVWLSEAFRAWSIEDRIATIRCPLLAIQGADDEYGTLAHLDGIAAQVPGAQTVVLPDCGHSPHRQAPAPLIEAIMRFVSAQQPPAATPP